MSSFIKKAWDLSLVHCVQTKNEEKMNQLMSILKEDKDFGKMYMLVNNLEKGIEDNPSYDIELFIQENRKIAKELDLSKIKNISLDTKSIGKNYPILEHINNVLFENVTPFNISKITHSMNEVKNHLSDLQSQKTSSGVDIEQLEEQYLSLTDEDKNFLLEFYKTPNNDKEKLFENKKQNILKKFKTLLENTSETQERLLIFETKNTIENIDYDEETCISDLVNIYDLEKQLFSDENV